MAGISESDRFECVVVNIIDNLIWKGVVVEELESGGRVYFSKLKSEGFDLQIGGTVYIGVKPVQEAFEGISMEVSLYDGENNKLDWTFA